MKTTNTLSESAKQVDAAHHALNNARKNLKQKRALFMQAQNVQQLAEVEFQKAKDSHDQQLAETV
jgi:hypothetical protein